MVLVGKFGVVLDEELDSVQMALVDGVYERSCQRALVQHIDDVVGLSVCSFKAMHPLSSAKCKAAGNTQKKGSWYSIRSRARVLPVYAATWKIVSPFSSNIKWLVLPKSASQSLSLSRLFSITALYPSSLSLSVHSASSFGRLACTTTNVDPALMLAVLLWNWFFINPDVPYDDDAVFFLNMACLLD